MNIGIRVEHENGNVTENRVVGEEAESIYPIMQAFLASLVDVGFTASSVAVVLGTHVHCILPDGTIQHFNVEDYYA